MYDLAKERQGRPMGEKCAVTKRTGAETTGVSRFTYREKGGLRGTCIGETADRGTNITPSIIHRHGGSRYFLNKNTAGL